MQPAQRMVALSTWWRGSSASADLSLRHGDDALSALDIATLHGRVDVMRALIQHGVDVDDASRKTGFTPLHVGASSNQVGAIGTLVEAGAGIDGSARSREWEPPLHAATRSGNSEVVVGLLRHGADVNKLDCEGLSALHVAASKNGSASIVEALLAAGANFSLRGGKKDTTALGLAVEAGNKGVVEALIQHKASLNAADESGRTPLHVAASYNAVAVTELLLAAGASVDVRDDEGERPLHVASAGGCSEIITALMKHGAGSCAFSAKGKAPLHLAADRGHVGATTTLLVAGADVNLGTENGWSALCVAVDKEPVKTDVLKVLIQHGADVNEADWEGATALHNAAYESDAGAIDALVAAGADIEAETCNGNTAFRVLRGIIGSIGAAKEWSQRSEMRRRRSWRDP